MEPVIMKLAPEMFKETEHVLVKSGSLSASSFVYPTGVCALKLANDRGEIIVLPFQGQQIWRARFCGHDLTMKSTFDDPVPTNDYLSTYGGFLLHCGMTAMGVPSSEDQHPLHGELPNRRYHDVTLLFGEDERGSFLALRGKTEYKVAFSVGYRAEPEIRLHTGATTFDVTLHITNLRQTPLAYMYLCHINYRPIDGAQLVYSALPEPEHVFAHQAHGEHLPKKDTKQLNQYIDAINQDPSVHHTVDRNTQCYDPEIVMTIRYRSDKEGYAHTMQVLPSGAAFYTAHRTRELPLGLRWIARTRDEDAMGMVLPCTAEHLGLAHARKTGQLKSLDGHADISFHMIVGCLEKPDADRVKKHIQDMLL